MSCFRPIKTVLLPLLLTVIFAPVSTSHALGLGTLTLKSHLNEKLDASLPVLLSGSESMHKVTVSLATPNEYRQMGLPWKDYLQLVRVELHGRNSDQPTVKLTTPLVMNAPLLSIVLKTSKEGRGTYFRHYKIFLDPAEMPSLYPEPEVVPVQRFDDGGVDDLIDEQGWSRIWRYGPVRSGDNLSEIAYRLRKDKRYSNKQVMMALYEANPDSFTDGNINLLKRGSWLTVPRGRVVKSYGSAASMQKLSQLLAAAPDLKPVTEKSPVSPTTSEELQYSGKIVLDKASGTPAESGQEAGVNQASLERLDAIHEEVMSGKLQMTDLGLDVARLDKSVSGIQEEVKSLKAEVKLLKAKAAEAPASDHLNYWMAAVVALLTTLIVVLMVRSGRRPVEGEWEKQSPVSAQKPEEEPAAPEPVAETEKPVVTAEPEADDRDEAGDEETQVDTLANSIEESLSQCDYEKAEYYLEVAEKRAPDSLRLSALKAQLYHETGRDELRNELINNISESSDKQRWEEFCKVLPAHVWNACFGDGSSDNGAVS